ncbi:odorant receptor 42b-like [Drosophila nasuta]|uniref:odorant receptor 42b-like n=1 Tax=Drosophila nasuta TaxID=42062 RepID=UPI00295EC219|nr:odorant receptor 42b-like [Drosophila nasuta]
MYSIIVTSLGFYLPFGMIISYVREFNNFTPKKAKALLDQLDKSCVTQEEKLQVHRSTIRSNSISFVYIIIYVFYPLTSICTAIINGVAPWNVHNPFLNWHDGKWQLGLTVVIEYFVVSIITYYHLAIDMCPTLFGMNIRLHLNLLNQRIQKLRTDDTESEDKDYEKLVGCITDHKIILKYCNVLRPLISRFIFVQFIMVGIICGLCLTNLIFFADLSTISYIFGCIFQTLPFCYICNLLDDDVNDLTLSIFQTNWFGCSRRYKSSLLYFMHQAQLPIHFTGGTIFDISLATKISLAKFAFSVVTIVQQFNLVEKLQKK